MENREPIDWNMIIRLVLIFGGAITLLLLGRNVIAGVAATLGIPGALAAARDKTGGSAAARQHAQTISLLNEQLDSVREKILVLQEEIEHRSIELANTSEAARDRAKSIRTQMAALQEERKLLATMTLEEKIDYAQTNH